MQQITKQSKYWKRVKANIKLIKKGLLTKERGYLTKRYKFEAFCNHFSADTENYEEYDNKCICDHDIYRNYFYKHKDRPDEYVILGCCCIKLFSKDYELQRTCKDCNIKIKVNKQNRCKECRNNYKLCKNCNKYINKNIKHCKDCCKEIQMQYSKCYKCRFQK
mgnify:FL=1